MNTGDLQYCGGDLYVSGNIQAGGTIGDTNSGGAEPQIRYDGTPPGVIANLVGTVLGGISSTSALTVGVPLIYPPAAGSGPIQPFEAGHLYTASGCLSFRMDFGLNRTIVLESFPEITLYIGDQPQSLTKGYLDANANAYCIMDLPPAPLSTYFAVKDIVVDGTSATLQYQRSGFFTIPFTTTLKVDDILPPGTVKELSVYCVYQAASPLPGESPLATWSASAPYYPGDITRYDGANSLFAKCIRYVPPSATGANPSPATDTTDWSPVQAWSAAAPYAVEDVVKSQFNTQVASWRCILAYTPDASSLPPGQDPVHWVAGQNGIGFSLLVTSGPLYETNIHLIDYGVPTPPSASAAAAASSVAPPAASAVPAAPLRRVLASTQKPVFAGKPPLTAAQRARSSVTVQRASTLLSQTPKVSVKTGTSGLVKNPVFAAPKKVQPVAVKKPQTK